MNATMTHSQLCRRAFSRMTASSFAAARSRSSIPAPSPSAFESASAEPVPFDMAAWKAKIAAQAANARAKGWIR